MVSLSNHADVETEEIGHEPRHPLEADTVGEAQIDHQGTQIGAVLRRAQEAIRASFHPAARP